MGGANTILEAALENLMAVMPFVIVKTYQAGIRWRWGKNPEALEPGFWWRVPLYHAIEICGVVDEAVELPPQTVCTKDGHPVTFTVNIAYRVVDILAHWTVEDFQASVKALAMTHLAQRVRAAERAELNGDGLTKLEKSLEGTLTTRFKDWGTKVFSVGFTNFADTPSATRLFLDIPTALSIVQSKDH